MKILGLDQSFTSTGWVIIEDNNFVDCGIISTKPSDGDIFTRARTIASNISDIADSNGIETVYLEGLAFGSTGDATRQLSGLQFLIVDTLRPIEVNIVPPTTLKKFASNKGNASKLEMYESLPNDIKSRFVDRKLLKTKGLYDCTDAYFLASYGFKNNC